MSKSIEVRKAPKELREVIAAYFEVEEAEMDGFESMKTVEIEDLARFLMKATLQNVRDLLELGKKMDVLIEKQEELKEWILDDAQTLKKLGELLREEN